MFEQFLSSNFNSQPSMRFSERFQTSMNGDFKQQGRERQRRQLRKITFLVRSLLLCAAHYGFVFLAINFVSGKQY